MAIRESTRAAPLENAESNPTTASAVAFIGTVDQQLENNRARGPVELTKLALAMALLAAMTGCVAPGYYGGVGPDYYGGVVTGPDAYVFGGGFERGRDVHAYSNRGAVSRRAAHSGGGGARGGGGGRR